MAGAVYQRIENWREDPTGIALGGIILLGAALRTYRLDSEAMWLDEVATIREGAGRSFVGVLVDLPLDDPHPPLYYLIVHVWTRIFGYGPVSLRSISVLAGVAAIPIVYLFARTVFDRRTGLIAGVLTAVSPFYIQYAQEARMYALFLLLTVTSMYLFVLLGRSGSHRTVGGYVVVAVLLAVTHVYGLFILLAQNIVWATYLATDRRPTFWSPPRRWLLAQMIVGLLLLPWIGVLVYRALSGGSPGWLPIPGWDLLRATWLQFLAGPVQPPFDPGIMAAASLALIGLALVNLAGLHDATARLVREEDLDVLYLLAAWAFVPIAVGYLISHTLSPIYWPRYAIGASLGLLLLIARGIAVLPRPELRWLLIGLVVATLFVPLGTYYEETQKQQFDQVVADIEAEATDDDIVLITDSYMIHPYLYYAVPHAVYVDQLADARDATTVPTTSVSDTADADTVRAEIQDAERVYLVVAHADHQQVERIRGVIAGSYFERGQRHYRGVQVYVYER